MGGFGSGGRRPGAGRKPKSKRERKVQGSRHRTRARDAGVPETPASKDPARVTRPRDLEPIARAVWDKLAPHAIAAGTLTVATAYAFQRVCELESRRRRMETQIDLDGLMVSVVEVDEKTGARFSIGEPRAHPLIGHERQLQQRVEAGFAKFAIAPNGKSLMSEPEKTDPFAEFDGPPDLKVVRGGKA